MKPHNKVLIHECPSGKKFNVIDEYIDFIRTSNYEGISFSGGEPFLYFADMLYCIKKLKKLPRPLYIWAYTCGDFITHDTMRYLKEAGLDELRFNIVARSYNIEPIAIASKYFNTVSVETPAIPGYDPVIKSLIPELMECNVKYINLHELNIGNYNKQRVIDEGFTIKNNIVLGSEKSAMSVIDFIDENNLSISVNYCSYKYKTNRIK
jgi:pyruvate formate-lyase activating enzyme-like uncharacterized protein